MEFETYYGESESKHATNNNSKDNCDKAAPKIFWFVFVILGLVGILVGYFVFLQPGEQELSDIQTTTERIFLPPVNTTSTCSFGDCIIITYNYGIIINNQFIITYYVSTDCESTDVMCINSIYNNLPLVQTVYYNINDPVETATRDENTYLSPYYRRNTGTAFVAIGGSICMVCFGLLIIWLIEKGGSK